MSWLWRVLVARERSVSLMRAWGAVRCDAEQAEWTVLVYMNSDNNLECFGVQVGALTPRVSPHGTARGL
jgi:hypothetical protein